MPFYHPLLPQPEIPQLSPATFRDDCSLWQDLLAFLLSLTNMLKNAAPAEILVAPNRQSLCIVKIYQSLPPSLASY